MKTFCARALENKIRHKGIWTGLEYARDHQFLRSDTVRKKLITSKIGKKVSSPFELSLNDLSAHLFPPLNDFNNNGMNETATKIFSSEKLGNKRT